MTEKLGLILIISSAVLFRLGGMGLKPFKKGWRRYILPLFFLGIGILIKLSTISNYFTFSDLCIAVLLSSAVYHLPYGEKISYPLKFVVGCTYSAVTLFLGFTIWQIIVPILFLGLFKLSNWKTTAHEFGWAICEIITGLGIGIIWARLFHLV